MVLGRDKRRVYPGIFTGEYDARDYSIWGGTAGNWGRRPIELDEIEIMVVGRKAAEPPRAPYALFAGR